MTDRPISERCGTPLDHRFTRKVVIKIKGRSVEVGTIDERQRIYQYTTEGGLSTAVFWKHRTLMMNMAEWEEICKAGVEWIEYTDLKPNRCYRIHIDVARDEGYPISGPSGLRYGIPLALWETDQAERPEERRTDPPASEQGALL
jgi:hypothetical protein